MKPVQNNKLQFIRGPVTPQKIIALLDHHREDRSIGAHDIFLGQVRADVRDGQQVSGITYTAYEEMAQKTYTSICHEVSNKFSVINIHTCHSLGLVEAGHWSLAVFVAAAHRAECFDACREMVERIKKELPVWGQEHFADGSSDWKINT